MILPPSDPPPPPHDPTSLSLQVFWLGVWIGLCLAVSLAAILWYATGGPCGA